MSEKTFKSLFDCKEIKQISPEYSLEGLMVKFQCFGHLILGKIEGRLRGGQDEMVEWHHQVDG